jgi:2Fe-2S ferredoxin
MECKMPIIKILPHEDICPKGLEINAKAGENICQMLLDNNIDIEHACDMSCACTTCHIIVRKGFQSLNEIKEQEEDLLDMAWGLTSLSRLSCQVIVGTDDLVVEIPKYTINHAKEN